MTCITPRYTQVEGLQVKNAYEWDMRISTAAIPRETLSRILLRHINQADPNERLRVVKLYIQAERYRDAVVELDRVIKDFPDLKDLEKERSASVRAGGRRRDPRNRVAAGCGPALAGLCAAGEFSGEGRVGRFVAEGQQFVGRIHRGAATGRACAAVARRSRQGTGEQHSAKVQIEALAQEIRNELNINNLDRLADYLRLADDEKLTAEQKLALAFSGWILGSGSGTPNFADAISLADARDAIRAYLRSDKSSGT